MRNTNQLALSTPNRQPQFLKNSKINLSDCSKFLQFLVFKNGPDPEDFEASNQVIFKLVQAAEKGEVTLDEINCIRAIFGEVLSTKALFGFVLKKPHGYAGDYEIIDKIYTRYESSDFRFTKWDHYFQEQLAVEAVRNRAEYFYHLLSKKLAANSSQPKPLSVLNLASGPGRDMLHFFETNPVAKIHIDCIEQDQDAITYASKICEKHLSKISFYKKNALRISTEKKYDLIWSAGLFDYFEDKIFITLLKRLKQIAAPNGELVIGNFSDSNPNKNFQDFCEWHLHHRSPSALTLLAHAAGFQADQIQVNKEPLGINLFLHLQGARNA
jgi:SAM-dependent methyltransferase